MDTKKVVTIDDGHHLLQLITLLTGRDVFRKYADGLCRGFQRGEI